MATDQDFDGVPDVLESIDSRLARILDKLPPPTKKFDESNITKSFSDLAKKLDARSADVQKFESSDDVRGKRREYYDAKASLASAPEDLKRAQEEHTRAMRDLARAQKQGQPTGDFEAALNRAKLKLMEAQDTMHSAPKRFQQAEGALRGAEAVADPDNKMRAGGGYKKAAKVADFFGLSSLSKTLNEYGDQAQLGVRAAAGDPKAAKELAEKQLKRRGEGVQQVFSASGKFMSSGRAGDMFAAGGQGIEGIGKAFNNPLVELVGKFAAKLGESVEKLRRYNDQLFDANMRFAEFSGAMAGVQAEQMNRQIMLNQQRGDRRSAFARDHMRSRQQLEENLSVFEDIGDNIKGWFLTKLNNFGNFFLTPISQASKQIAEDVGLLRRAEEKPDNMMDWVDAVTKEHMEEAMSGRPARFNNGYGMRG